MSNNKFGDNGLFMLKLGLLANRSVDRLFLSGSRVTCEGMCERTDLCSFMVILNSL